MTSEESPHSWPALPGNAAEFLAAIVRSSDDAIYSKDENAILTSWNPAAQKLYGFTPEEAVGQPISILIPPELNGEEIDILEKILAGERIEHYETERMRKDGSRVEVSVSVSPVYDKEGRIVEAAAIARDITEQKRLERELETAREAQATSARKQALALNDVVVQGLAAAKMALETGGLEEGLRTVTATLEKAKAIVTGLLAEGGDTIHPGDLVRDEPAVIKDPSA